ncbi:MAG: carboxylesterase family protein [Pseudomonadota bacterium]
MHKKVMLTIGIALVLFAGGAFSQSRAAEAKPPTVATTGGLVSGFRQGDSNAYFGLPFAQPPVGNLRWRAPLPPRSWSGVRDGSRFGANCYQAEGARFGPYTPEFMIDSSPVSEDCLYLNIWTPAKGGISLPILVWIHGGGFGGGSGSVPIYNGARLAAKGAIVVTVNYRVGAFGFLAHPGLSAETPDRASGNYGMQDVVSSLEWVRDNASRFGGDPRRVTVVGQSAGAMAINALLLSPKAQGLFAGAITESGTAAGSVLASLKDSEAIGAQLASKLNVRTIEELRNLSAESIVKASGAGPPLPGAPPRVRLAPNIDGKFIVGDPNDPNAVLRVKVPQISGYNRDEGRGVTLGQKATTASFEEMVRAQYKDFAERILAAYPHATDADATLSAYTLPRDAVTVTHAVFGQMRTANSSHAFYPYVFEHVYPGPESELFGSFHTAEVPYLFGVLDQQGRPFNAEDRRISEEVQAYWLNFMRTGNPNGKGLPSWPASRAGSMEVMWLGDRAGARPACSTPERAAVLRDYVNTKGYLAFL